MSLDLSTQFQSSYKQLASYPQNLSDRHSYAPTLRAYRGRLDSASPRLLLPNEDVADVSFRDLDAAGNLTARVNIWSDQKLRNLLGDTAIEDPLTHSLVSGSYATKADPKCRFVFLWAKSSRAPLDLTRSMLTRILSYHQVMPRYLEFLFLFGQRPIPHDLQYSGFREQTDLNTPAPDKVMPKLGRSGRQYQLCFNLKSVDLVSPPGTLVRSQMWSIRQAGIYHKFDVEHGTTLWIITKALLDLKDSVQEITGQDGRPEDRSFATAQESLRASLAIVTLLAHWATNNWRWYIQWLEDTVSEETRDAINGNRADIQGRKEYSPGDLQNVQNWEERANETVAVLESNAAVLTAIQEYYLSLLTKNLFPLKDQSKDDVLVFADQMKDLIADCKMQSVRARLLVQIASQRKQLVLQHLQSQATEIMEKLGFLAQKEAVAMRIITVVTLIYLPATFVSTFFSTDVVKYQNQSGGSSTSGHGEASYSSLAMMRWLQVTLPLTFVTFLISWLAYTKAKRNISVHVLAKKAFGDMSLLPVRRP